MCVIFINTAARTRRYDAAGTLFIVNILRIVTCKPTMPVTHTQRHRHIAQWTFKPFELSTLHSNIARLIWWNRLLTNRIHASLAHWYDCDSISKTTINYSRTARFCFSHRPTVCVCVCGVASDLYGMCEIVYVCSVVYCSRRRNSS